MIASYKCLNCGGSMVFEPASQRFVCEYCTSSFSNEEVQKAQHKSDAQVNESSSSASSASSSSSSFEQNDSSKSSVNNQTVFFTCPSCGAEIAASSTEMIATCFYCHNSVVRSQNTGNAFNPDSILPFSIPKEKAKETFIAWAKKKKFVPQDFFSKKQIENLTGVYYPYWLTEYSTNASAQYKATNIRSWESGDTRFTETSTYSIERSGNFCFPNITKRALSKEDSRIGESVQPFEFKALVPYTPSYLLGFQSQCRDMEKESIIENVESEVKGYSEALLKDSVKGYSSVRTKSSNVSIVEKLWKYVLLPVWVVTYKGNDGKIYSYAINGQTGKTCGELPVSFKRILALFFAIFVPVTAIISALDYFLW